MNTRFIDDSQSHKDWMESRMSLERRLHTLGAKFNMPIGFEAEKELKECRKQVDKLHEFLGREGYVWKTLDGKHYDWYK